MERDVIVSYGEAAGNRSTYGWDRRTVAARAGACSEVAQHRARGHLLAPNVPVTLAQELMLVLR